MQCLITCGHTAREGSPHNVLHSSSLVMLSVSILCCHGYTVYCSDVEEAQSQGGDGDGGPVVPLLMMNKPPVEEERDRIADVTLRPDEVIWSRAVYIYSFFISSLTSYSFY